MRYALAVWYCIWFTAPVLFMCICYVCRICGEENLFTESDVFFRYAEQPSLWHDVNRTLRRLIKLFIYRRRCLARRHMINLRSLMYEASWSRKVYLREVSGKSKYLRIKIWFFDVHRVMKPRAELIFHEARITSCRILATTTGFITRWTSKK